MARRDIMARLRSGDRLLLDGATGSELQRRGVNVSRGVTTQGGLGAWSATAMEDAPEVVRAVHEDYLRVGAEIITTNSFWTNRARLEMVGLAHKAEEYTRRAAEIARDARDRLKPEAYVAGSIAPSGRADVSQEVSEQATVLAGAGVDLLLLEYFGPIPDCVNAVQAASGMGLPVFLGLRHVTLEGKLQKGETVGELVSALKGSDVQALLPMCSQPEGVSAILPKLRESFRGILGAYANIGYKRSAQPVNYPEQQWHVIEGEDYPPQRYAEFARQWLEMGAQIVGGCCATTPEHIAAVRQVIPS